MKIKIDFFDLPTDKVRTPIAYYLELNDNYITYNFEAKIDVEANINLEEYETQENIHVYENFSYKRDVLTGVTLFYSQVDEIDIYTVGIDSIGQSSIIKLTLNNRKQAEKIKKQILDYILAII